MTRPLTILQMLSLPKCVCTCACSFPVSSYDDIDCSSCQGGIHRAICEIPRSNHVAAFDLDGTLIRVSKQVDYEDAATLLQACNPMPDPIRLVCQLWATGAQIAYVTGRAEHVRDVTRHQLTSYGLPTGRLLMSPKWDGYDVMSQTKAAHLRTLRASLFVGDHDADELAARLAGVPFLHADAFALEDDATTILTRHGRRFSPDA